MYSLPACNVNFVTIADLQCGHFVNFKACNVNFVTITELPSDHSPIMSKTDNADAIADDKVRHQKRQLAQRGTTWSKHKHDYS